MDEELRQALADLKTGQKKLPARITEIRDDIAVHHGAADHVRQANDNARTELRSLTARKSSP